MVAASNGTTAKKPASMLSLSAQAAVAATLIAYGIFGIVYLCTDQDVIRSCHASTADVHVIWPTDLWIYVLVSIVGTLLCAVWLVSMVVLRRPVDSTVWDESEPLDWRMLWTGFVFSGMGLLMAVFGYWGYTEAYLANPWCENKTVVWEELDLARFARVTLWIQFVFSLCFIAAGWICWSVPFALELKRMITGEDASDASRGSRPMPGRGSQRPPVPGKQSPSFAGMI